LSGWIKLYRELLDKPIWFESTPEQKSVLMTLLLMASHKENEWEWKGKKQKSLPGQFVTSLPKIAQKAGKGISIQNVRTALLRFEKYEFLTGESTNQNRLITILNWASYQRLDDEEEKEIDVTQQTNQQATNRQLTAINNVRTKELKELKDIRPKSATSEEDLKFANLLFDLVQQNYPNAKKPNLEKWANDFRLLREMDHALPKDFKYIIEWSQNHTFWKSNIRSADKFRKQYQTLYIQAEEAYKKGNKVVSMSKHKQIEKLREQYKNEDI
jgi:hypothetical protein